MTGRRALDRQREPLPTRADASPPLPAAYGHALDVGLEEIGVELTRAEREGVDGHVRLLLAWNTAINLTAIRDPAEVAIAHVVDSLTALPILRERGVERFIDLGSGGGFPGIPLAVALPAERALLVDSIAKKIRFLETVTAAIGVDDRVETRLGRMEALARDPRHRYRWPAITARAVAGLAELIELSFPLLAQGGLLVAWKRGDLDAELGAGERALTALGGGSVETMDVRSPRLPGHRLMLVRKSGATPAAFPRDPAVRRRNPW